MYDPNKDATRDQERFPLDGETLFQHVHRVVEHWKDNQPQLLFDTLPAELRRDYPDIFGRFDNERLGIIISLVWIYLGASTVNDATIRKWFREAIG
jgi:hypothetical protein